MRRGRAYNLSSERARIPPYHRYSARTTNTWERSEEHPARGLHFETQNATLVRGVVGPNPGDAARVAAATAFQRSEICALNWLHHLPCWTDRRAGSWEL